MPDPGSTDRTRIRRLPELAITEQHALHDVLDAGLIAHVSVVDNGLPYVIPVAFARSGQQVLFHGSSGSRLFTTLADGQPTCLTVTLLDGLVLARSAFESSMNYRSVMVLGSCLVVPESEKTDALRAITDHLLPGRWESLRPVTRKELAATIVLSLALDECSVKIRTGGSDEPEEDQQWPVWAGVLPIHESFGIPVPMVDLDPAIDVPEHVRKMSR
jgi:hypothetical protein